MKQKMVDLMKEIKKLFIAVIYFSLLSACDEQLWVGKEAIYLPNRQWIFTVKKSNREIFDTLLLITFKERWEYSALQRKINWKFIMKDTIVTENIEETGVIDRARGGSLLNLIFGSEIWIHPPRSSYLRLAEMVPFPNVKLPPKLGQRIDWELTPKKGWGEFEGVKVNGKLVVSSKIFFDNPIVKDTCWVIDAFGKSKIGNFKAQYYFHEKLGFVYFFYDFAFYKVEINLIAFKQF